MKVVPVWLAMTALPALVVGVAQQRPAAPGSPVAYVSAQRISNETTEGKAGVARMQALQRERADQVRFKQQALEATRRQLAAAQGADRASLQAQEQQQRGELEKAALQAQADLQGLQRTISTELTPKVKTVVAEIVKDTGIQMVLSGESAVVWAADGLDLTSRVIAKMNAQPAVPPAPGQ